MANSRMPSTTPPLSPTQGSTRTLSNEGFMDLSSDEEHPRCLTINEQLTEFKIATSSLLKKQKKLKAKLVRERLRREELMKRLAHSLQEVVVCGVAQDVMIKCWTLQCGHTFRIDTLVGLFNHALADACRARNIPIHQFPIPEKGPFRPIALAYFKRKLKHRSAIHYKCPLCRERIVTKPVEVQVLRELLTNLIGTIESDETPQRALKRAHEETIAHRVEGECGNVDWGCYFF